MNEVLDAIRETRSGKFSSRRIALLIFVTPLSLIYMWMALTVKQIDDTLPDIPRGPIAIVAILSGSAAFQRKSTTPQTPSIQ